MADVDLVNLILLVSKLVEECVADKDLRAVCIREIQKSIKYSSKQLIEDKN